MSSSGVLGTALIIGRTEGRIYAAYIFSGVWPHVAAAIWPVTYLFINNEWIFPLWDYRGFVLCIIFISIVELVKFIIV